MNRYRELKNKQFEEFAKFPIAFAFSDEQVKEGLKNLGLNENDIDKVTGIGAGGFIKKTDLEKYIELNKKFRRELKEAIAEDKTGEFFIKDIFDEELANHEYGFTMEIHETIEAIGISVDEINANDNLKNGLRLALERYERENNEEEELE